jgi:membrane protein
MLDRASFIGWQLRAIREALLHLNDNDGFAMASHVALSVMIAIFPFLIFAVSLASMVSSEDNSRAIIDLVFDLWPEDIAEPIVREIEAVVDTSSASFLTVGILLALFFSSNGVEAIRVALNRAYGDIEGRSMLRQRLQGLVFVISGAMLLTLISLLLIFAPIYFSFIDLSSAPFYHWMINSNIISGLLAFLLLTFVVFACHRWLPGKRRPLTRLFPGILMTLALWIIAAIGFSLYIQSFANYSATYAGLSGIMTALIFLYLMAVILTFGAEYNSALARMTFHKSQVAER